MVCSRPTASRTAVGRVRTTTDLPDAVEGADVVVECVFEDLALKQDVFERLDAACLPETILCTNTSVMSITQIGERAAHKERVVGTHFWNPPYLIPLVEVVRTEQVDPAVVDRTMDLLRRVGKHPIDCKKDVPGFVANRLQHALWREAISIVEHGIADAATVDESIRFGPGLRLPILAPDGERRHGRSGPHPGHPRLHPAAPGGVSRAVAAAAREGRRPATWGSRAARGSPSGRPRRRKSHASASSRISSTCSATRSEDSELRRGGGRHG